MILAATDFSKLIGLRNNLELDSVVGIATSYGLENRVTVG
jgi:hypothetical protein